MVVGRGQVWVVRGFYWERTLGGVSLGFSAVRGLGGIAASGRAWLAQVREGQCGEAG